MQFIHNALEGSIYSASSKSKPVMFVTTVGQRKWFIGMLLLLRMLTVTEQYFSFVDSSDLILTSHLQQPTHYFLHIIDNHCKEQVRSDYGKSQ